MRERKEKLLNLSHLGIRKSRGTPWGIKRPPEIILPPSVNKKNKRYLPEEPLKIKL